MSKLVPNRSRVRVYDARDLSVKLRETFTDRPVEHETSFPFDWPHSMQQIGDSLGVAYASDKWQKRRGDMILYKHLAESRNRIFCVPGCVYHRETPTSRVGCIGPMVAFGDVVMPDSFAELALFREVNVQLYTGGTDERPEFHGDDGIMTLTVAHGRLGGGYMKTGSRDRRPFLFVYTQTEVMFLIVGEKLDILKDGIVG